MVTRNKQRTLWGLSVRKIWIPFFTRCNSEGHTAIPGEDLKNPYNPKGSIKSTLTLQAASVKGNFEAGLVAYSEGRSEVPVNELTKKR